MDQSLSPRFRLLRRLAVLLLPAVLSGAAVSTRALATNVETPRIVLTPEVSHGDVTVSIASSVTGVQGWSFGLCHDPEKARIVRFDPSDELAVINGGEPPYFYKCELASLVDGDGHRVEGVIQAVVLSLDTPIYLPQIPEGFPVLKLEYQVEGETSIGSCSGLHGTGQPVSAILTILGRSIPFPPANATLLPKPYAAQLSWRVEPPQSSGVVSVRLASSEMPVEGWSLALCHTGGAAEALEVSSSWELETILDGEPPDFVKNGVTAGGTFVAVTQSVVLGSSGAPRARGPFPEGLPVLDIRYQVLAEEDHLKFCDRLDATPLDNRVSIEGVRYLPATRLGATLVRGALATRFIRGDADLSGIIDLTDPIFVLSSLFMTGASLPCLDAADSNGVGGEVDISDPIFTLRFLFLGGPTPPQPFPEPGEALGRSLGCERGL